MARKRISFINTAGEVVVRTTTDFSDAATDYFKFFPRESHMRTRRFSVVLLGDDVVAGEMYSDGGNMMKVSRRSKHWKDHRSDRLAQLAEIREELSTDHPLASAILEDIEWEVALLKK